ncbi:hypothetical protein [Dactylosporangium sp. NPDC006015]|uniref:hypothetical protein n=1 Tax=Dactylosporangium sp. NPDC006015 TaxID=3154576 RepID=UPI0033BCE398
MSEREVRGFAVAMDRLAAEGGTGASLAEVVVSIGVPVYEQRTIWLQETMFLDWRPVLDALGLPALAQLWGTSNVGGPAWPVVTELPPAVLTTELEASGWRERLEELPDDAFIDPDGDPLEDAYDVREELADSLELLAAWCVRTTETAPTASLVLVMHGDQ